MKVYGYARCSTDEHRQDIDRQKRELVKLGVKEEMIFWEYESGTKRDRVELNRLLSILQPGDTVVTTEVSRLARSTQMLCDIIDHIQDKQVRLMIGSLDLDCRPGETTNAMTKGMLQMFGVFAEMERNIISERVKSGLENAKAKGKQLGRPELTRDDIPSKFDRYYADYVNGKYTVTELSKLMGKSRTTIYKYIKLIEG